MGTVTKSGQSANDNIAVIGFFVTQTNPAQYMRHCRSANDATPNICDYYGSHLDCEQFDPTWAQS